MDFLRASGGIISKTTLGESEESYSDLRANGNCVMRIRVTRGLGVVFQMIECYHFSCQFVESEKRLE